MVAPVLTSLNPATIEISQGTDVEVIITGTDFDPAAVLCVNGSETGAGAFVSATEMRAILNTYMAGGAATLQLSVSNSGEISNELPLELTGQSAQDDPNFIPDTPEEGASPNTPAERVEYMAPEPPDVYQQAAPVQFREPTKTGEPTEHTPDPEELPTTNANEDGGLPTNPREPYPSGNPLGQSYAEINGRG